MGSGSPQNPTDCHGRWGGTLPLSELQAVREEREKQTQTFRENLLSSEEELLETSQLKPGQKHQESELLGRVHINLNSFRFWIHMNSGLHLNISV